MIDCVLVIVAYQSAGEIRELLESVPDAAGALSWSAVVVNNSPSDDLGAVVEPYPEVTVVTPGENLGYSGGLNAGVAAAEPSRLIFFLNPDLILHPGALRALADAVTGSDGAVSAAVPTILDQRGGLRHSLRREPSLPGALGEALFGNHWANRPPALTEIVRDAASYRSPHPVEWATGAAMMVRRDMVSAVGEWDSSRFFLYSEETDYCNRIREQGGQIWFTPGAQVRHREAGSGSSPALDALLEVNKVRYYRKWHAALPAVAFALVTILRNALRAHRPSSRAALIALLSRRARSALPGGAR
ncbi:MAG: glycosyltransferase family 2 protein [Homoserinimonas sp.]